MYEVEEEREQQRRLSKWRSWVAEFQTDEGLARERTCVAGLVKGVGANLSWDSKTCFEN